MIPVFSGTVNLPCFLVSEAYMRYPVCQTLFFPSNRFSTLDTSCNVQAWIHCPWQIGVTSGSSPCSPNLIRAIVRFLLHRKALSGFQLAG